MIVTPLLVMPSLFNRPVSSKENAGWQTDAAGNVSDIGKNALRIVVDNTGLQ
jgi:hypothetical protein